MDELDLIEEPERTQVARLARQLHEQRPVPRAVFRGDLRRTLVAEARGLTCRHGLSVALANAVGGGGLLTVVALGVAGVGPLAV